MPNKLSQQPKKRSLQPTFAEFMAKSNTKSDRKRVEQSVVDDNASSSTSHEFKNVASTSSYCMATDKADIVRDVMENMLTKLEADDGSISKQSSDDSELVARPPQIFQSIDSEVVARPPDISKATNEKLSDIDKQTLIRLRCPPSSFVFPSIKVADSRLKSGYTLRYCQHEWFRSFEHLTYSFIEDSVFCLPCALFPTISSNSPTNLVTKGYRNWKKLLETVKKHERDATGCHKLSVTRMKSFCDIVDNKTLPINRIMDKKLNETIQENRKAIRSIIEALLFCGRQGLPLRGHRDTAGKFISDINFNDDGVIEFDDEQDIVLSDVDYQKTNPGNFLALLKFRLDAGDRILSKHLATARSNALYISNRTQNELLECIRSNIMEKVKDDIHNQNGRIMYSVLADEVTDTQNLSQLGVAIRYIDKRNTIKERCIGFKPLDSMVGVQVAKDMLDSVKELGLDPKDTVGLGLDGAGNMAGKHNGAQAHYRKEAPKAVYFHCASHSLNLALSATTKQATVKCMIDTLQKLGIYFKYSPKRQRVLTSSLDSFNQGLREAGKLPVNTKKVKVMCETRWVERHTNLVEFKSMYSPILTTLETVISSDGWDSKAKTEAQGLLSSITSSNFIVAFSVHFHLMGYTKQLSVSLQGSSNDILRAYGDIEHVAQSVAEEREEGEFPLIRQCIEDMCSTSGIILAKPRISSVQRNRENHPGDSPMLYYTRSVTIPVYDHLISQLGSRFSTLTKSCVSALKLLPSNICSISTDDVEAVRAAYEQYLPEPASFMQEYSAYAAKCKTLSDTVKNTLDSEKLLNMLPVTLYPNMYHLFKVLFTFPVTSADVERANSALDFIKTCKRSVMGQNRFNALVLMYIHKGVTVNVDRVIDRYSSLGNRRLQFINKK